MEANIKSHLISNGLSNILVLDGNDPYKAMVIIGGFITKSGRFFFGSVSL